MSRNGHEWTDRFSSIAKALEELPEGCVVDGEVIVNDPRGRSSFGLLQAWLKYGRGPDPIYMAFDLMQDRGELITDQPLEERKRRLKLVIPKESKLIKLSEHFDDHGSELFADACRLGLEGIIAKRSQAPYVQGRTGTWLKRKCVLQEEFVVGGFEKGKGSRLELGALLLGQFDADGKFRYCGKAGSGFDDKDVTDFSAEFHKLETETNPFEVNRENLPKHAVWVNPKLVVEIKYAERTSTGLLRQAVFLGRREDKKVNEVHAEKTNLSGVEITHPDRVLFPESDVTKAELAAYYDEVSEYLLPFLKGRPLSVVRCPEGAGDSCFIQKHIAAGMPTSLGLKVKGEEETLIGVKTPKDLLSLAQFGVIEIHPWGSKLPDLDAPDTLTFDLDPGPGVSWSTVIQATLALHERLNDLGLSSFVKTSGGKGFHVVVSLQPGTVPWDDLKKFAKAVADDMDRLVPNHFVSVASKAKRQGRIFIDYLRNGRGATSVAPFVVRSRPGAPVSVPVSWGELPSLESASTFTVENRSNWLPTASKLWLSLYEKPNAITAEMWEKVNSR